MPRNAAARRRTSSPSTRVAKSAARDPRAAMIERIDAALARADLGEAAGVAKADATPIARPFSMAGVPGTAMFGGVVSTRETNAKLVGSARWRTFGEMKANNDGGVGTAIRLLLGLVGKVDWRWPAAADAASQTQAEEAAERVKVACTNGATSWRRVVRSLANFLPDGYMLAEWAVERKRTGDLGVADIQVRPQHTIDRWIRDPRSREITGVVQRDPETGRQVPISRKKLIYLVDDAMTDSPIGLGLLRQAVKGVHRLTRYEWLEGIGFETNLRGVPVVRAPLSALRRAVAAKELKPEEAAAIIAPLEEIIEHHVRSHDTGYMLDSEPHRNPDGSATSAPAFGVELLKGDASGEDALGKSIARERFALAALFGAQVLLAGEGGRGSFALSKQQAELAIMLVEGILADIAEALYRDLVVPVGALNNIPEELLPRPQPAGLLARDPETLAAMLRDLAASDPHGDDPAVDEVRTSQGLSPRPVRSPDELAALRPAPDDDAGDDAAPAGAAPDEDDPIDEED